MPRAKETAVGYESPLVQESRNTSSNGKYRWYRPGCRNNDELHYCVPGYHESCGDVNFEGHTYRLNVVWKAAAYTLLRDKNEVIYRGTFPVNWAEPPIYSLSMWQGKWVLEVLDQLIVDGVNFNQEQGYRRVFNWVIWREHPLYFFEKDGVVKLNYAGYDMSLVYSEVLHNQCCSGAMHNIIGCDESVTFYGKRGPKWYYVELTFPADTVPSRL